MGVAAGEGRGVGNAVDGDIEGDSLGLPAGLTLGTSDGFPLGFVDGDALGDALGLLLGLDDGEFDGDRDGLSLGALEFCGTATVMFVTWIPTAVRRSASDPSHPAITRPVLTAAVQSFCKTFAVSIAAASPAAASAQLPYGG